MSFRLGTDMACGGGWETGVREGQQGMLKKNGQAETGSKSRESAESLQPKPSQPRG